MKKICILFNIDNRQYTATVEYIPTNGFIPAVGVVSICMNPPLSFFYKETLDFLNNEIERILIEDKSALIPTSKSDSKELAIKPTLGACLAHVFKGKEGNILSRLEDIRKMAESEMSEEEKKTSKDLMSNISKFAKGK